MKKALPILLTMGDVNGVGPEIIAKLFALGLDSMPGRQFPLVVGSQEALDKALDLIQEDLPIKLLEDVRDWSPDDGIQLIEAQIQPKIQPGQICSEAGLASIEWVKHSVKWIQAGWASALVTAPLSKAAVEPSVPGFQGHTEYIGEMCGDPEPVLALVHDDWVVAHVSTHVSLREACDRVQKPRVLKTTQLLIDLLKKRKPLGETVRVGMAGLNPHAGEGGLFGGEEIEVLQPLVQEFSEPGVELSGPIPGDVVFPQMKGGHFDGVVAMYHDQGHVVTKTLAFELGEKRQLRGVNITLGLDVIRTSVDHGTGFDLAWKGQASEASLMDAFELAYQVTRENRN